MNTGSSWLNQDAIRLGQRLCAKFLRQTSLTAQALGNGAPHNGSAARFDDLGLYLFAKESDARSFVKDRE